MICALLIFGVLVVAAYQLFEKDSVLRQGIRAARERNKREYLQQLEKDIIGLLQGTHRETEPDSGREFLGLYKKMYIDTLHDRIRNIAMLEAGRVVKIEKEMQIERSLSRKGKKK